MIRTRDGFLLFYQGVRVEGIRANTSIVVLGVSIGSNILLSPLAGESRPLVQVNRLSLRGLPNEPVFSSSFTALQLFSCIILWVLSLQFLSSLSSHSSLLANAGATDIPVAVSAVNIPVASSTSIKKLFLFNINLAW